MQTGNVLICAPTGRDGSLLQRYLLKDQIHSACYASIERLAEALDDSVQAVIIAEEALVPAHRFWALPEEKRWANDGIDFVAAASFPLAYGTSYHALKDRARLKAGETLLVLGAAGGVGIAAVQFGKLIDRNAVPEQPRKKQVVLRDLAGQKIKAQIAAVLLFACQGR